MYYIPFASARLKHAWDGSYVEGSVGPQPEPSTRILELYKQAASQP